MVPIHRPISRNPPDIAIIGTTVVAYRSPAHFVTKNKRHVMNLEIFGLVYSWV